MDYEYDDYEPYEGRVLWGRIGVYAGTLVLAFVLGGCIFGGGASQSDLEFAMAEVEGLQSENTRLEEELTQAQSQNVQRPTVDGTPGAEPSPGATEGLEGGSGVSNYTVEAGDTLFTIAQQEYGDGEQFELIAEANNLTSDSPLTIGQDLVIPPLPDDEEADTDDDAES